MNAAIFWLDVALLGLLTGHSLGAEAKETPVRNDVSAPVLLNPARVFDTRQMARCTPAGRCW